MPKKLDDCVNSDKWKGKMNKKTHKPYTKNEKIAICKSSTTKSEVVEVEGCWYQVKLEEPICSSLVQKLNFPTEGGVGSGDSVQSNSIHLLPVEATVMEALELTDGETEIFQSITPTDKGTFWVMAGMEGQKAEYQWETRKVEASFFKKRFKEFKGKFYYLGHRRRGEVEARVAKIVKSELRKVGKAQKIALFHEIKPKNPMVASDIEQGYLSDVSIDAFQPVLSEDKKSIIDGLPYGVAFVAALPKMKGCPVCKVVHDPAESCITSECPSGTTEVSGQINEKTEVVKLADNKEEKEKVEKTVEEPSGAKASGSGVPDDKYDAVQSELTTIRKQLEEQKFGNACQALAVRAKVESSVVMSIVSGEKTPQDRMNSLEAVIKAHEDEKKNIMKSKVVEDKKLASTGSGEKATGDGEYDPSMFESTLAELEGQVIEAEVEVESEEEEEGEPEDKTKKTDTKPEGGVA
jgi:hypothetical protein